MSVNESVYKPKYAYSYKISTTGEEIPLFTTTDTLPNILSQNPSWQQESTRDSSDVFTTFSPNGLNLFGSTHTTFDADYEQSPEEPKYENEVGVKHLTVQKSGQSSINIRYIFKEQNSYNLNKGHGYRWTNLGTEYENFLSTIQGETQKIKYTDINYMYSATREIQDYAIPYNVNYGLASIAEQYVIDINRDNLFYAFKVEFAYIDDNGAYKKVSNVPSDIMLNWLKTDSSGFLNYDGHTCFVWNIYVYLMVRSKDSKGNDIFRIFSGITRTDKETGESKTVISGSGASAGIGIYLQCEKYVNGNLYYYSMPITNNDDTYTIGDGQFTVYRGRFLSSNASYPSASGSMNPYTATNNYSFTNGTTLETGFNSGVFFVAYDDMDIVVSSDDFFSDFNNYSLTYQIRGRTLLAKNSPGTSAVRRIIFTQYMFSGAEIMGIFASTLIPFAVAGSLTTSTQISENTDADTLFIGVRDGGGTVSGNYIPYIWGVTKPEEEFRPPDFEPINPVPSEPVSPDTDKDGKDSGTVAPAGKVTVGATNGFVTYYALSASQIRAIGKSLWGNNNPNDVLKNFFMFDFTRSETNYELSYAEILDYFVSLKYFPFNIPSYADTQGTGEQGIRIGTGATLIDAGAVITTNIITNPIAVIDGGTCTVPSYYNSFMDDEPIAVASLYVPFCGTAEVLLSAITDKPITLTYYVDMVTGCCIAIVQATGIDGVYPVAELTGVMGFDMMLTGNNHNQQLSSVISSIRHTAVNSLGSIASAVGGAVSGNIGQAVAGVGAAATSIANTAIDMPQTAALHPLTSGTSSSLAALSSYHTAFIQVKRKNSITPSNYAGSVGYIANQTASIGSISGFTQVVNPNLSGIPATADELAMIRDILISGFYA